MHAGSSEIIDLLPGSATNHAVARSRLLPFPLRRCHCQKPGLSTSSISSMLLATFFAISDDRGSCFRPQGRAVLGLTWVNLGLFLLYVLNTWILFEHEY